MADTEDVTLAIDKNGSKDPVRVSKTDFDADQAKPSGERQYKPYTGKNTAEPSTTGLELPNGTDGAPPLASPSAPHFGDAQTPDNIDPLRGAVAPPIQSPDGRYVMLIEGKYKIVDNMGKVITDQPPIDPAGYKTEAQAQKVINDLPH